MLLRSFVDLLDAQGKLVRIAREVDAEYEIAAVISKLQGRPVLFERVKGHRVPVVANVCASREFVCQGLGIERADLIGHLSTAATAPREPEVVPAAGYEEIDVDLNALPILRHYREDGGRYIASGVAVARDRDHGLNASFHRSMVRGSDELVLRIVERHLHAYIQRGLTELALCIGNPIPVLVAAAMSVELGKSELAIANALSPIRLVELGGHLVPEAELVLVGQLTGEQADEGPFLDLTGTFDIVRRQPVLHVTRVFSRRDPLFHALLPGDLEHEVLMGMPREPTIFREVSAVCACLDVRVTRGGCSWLHGAVRIRKQHDEDGRRAIEAAFRGHPSMKHVFVVDQDIDIDDPRQIEWAMATRFQADRDMVVKQRQKGSSLDPSSDPAAGETTKVGFDLTVPLGQDPAKYRRVPLPLEVDLDDYL